MARACVAVLALGLCGGCGFDAIPLDGKRCPCAPGWVCDTARNLCVERLDAGVRDAGRDAAEPAADAGRDARMDAGAPAGDAGPVDAGSLDAPSDGGPDETACDDLLSGAAFCDGFEDVALAAWSSREEIDGTVERVTSPTYRGRGALRGETTAPQGRAAMLAEIPSVTSGDLYIRGYFMVPEEVDLVGVSFVYALEWVDPYDGVAAGLQSEGESFAWIGPSSYVMGTGATEQGRWFCMQVHTHVADAGGYVEVFVDGVRHVNATGYDTLPAGGFVRLYAGLERANEYQPSAIVYADEIAVGTSPLPCD